MRSWYPQDGRITELGLHVSADPALRYDVALEVRATTARTS